MARGKNKLRKGERLAAKTLPIQVPGSLPAGGALSGGGAAGAASDAVASLGSGSSGTRGHAHVKRVGNGTTSLDYEDDAHEYEVCDHSTNISVVRMRKVARSISQLFSASFEVAVPSLFKGMIQNLQDQVLKDKIMSFVEHGLTPEQIKFASLEGATRKGIRSQIRLACEEELGDVVLRLSTEDCFDLLCDLAVRHGRDLKQWGPPCACSFSKCLPCLERLVDSVKSDPVLPLINSTNTTSGGGAGGNVKAIGNGGSEGGGSGGRAVTTGKATSWGAGISFQPKPIQPQSLHEWIQELINNDWVEGDDWRRGSSWKQTITTAWQNMADTLWACAKEIVPTELPNVQQVHRALTELNGLDLYYSVVTREIAALKGAATASGATPPGSKRSSGAAESKSCSNAAARNKYVGGLSVDTWLGGNFRGADAFSFSLHFENLRRETIRSLQEAHQQQPPPQQEGGSGAKSGGKDGGKSVTKTPLVGGLNTDALFDWNVRDETGETHRKALARAVREQGNAAYASGDYQEATEHYTRAIGYDATEAIFPLNRAACLLKLKKFAEAERDCSAALALDPHNHKAYFRRGVSRAALLKVEPAKRDFDKVLSLQDANPEARDGLQKLSEHFLAEARRREEKLGNDGHEETSASGGGAAEAAVVDDAEVVNRARSKDRVGRLAGAATITEGEDSSSSDADADVDADRHSASSWTDTDITCSPSAGDGKAVLEDATLGQGAAAIAASGAMTRAATGTVTTKPAAALASFSTRSSDSAPGVSVSSTPSTVSCKTPSAAEISGEPLASQHDPVYTSSPAAADPSEVALQVAFSFIFGQLVKQQTGVDVALLHNDGSSGAHAIDVLGASAEAPTATQTYGESPGAEGAEQQAREPEKPQHGNVENLAASAAELGAAAAAVAAPSPRDRYAKVHAQHAAAKDKCAGGVFMGAGAMEMVEKFWLMINARNAFAPPAPSEAAGAATGAAAGGSVGGGGS